MPLLYLLKMIPVAGTWIFSAAITVWAWYWMGVFTASKNAHAWADDGVAGSPHPVRVFNTGVSKGCLLGPLRLYGRIWAWAVKGLSAPAAVFERTPAPFLGLAWKRSFRSAGLRSCGARAIGEEPAVWPTESRRRRDVRALSSQTATARS
jgi:hypothetical protein